MKIRPKYFHSIEAVVQGRSVKKSVLGNSTKFTGKHLCQVPFFSFITKETPTEVISMFSRDTIFEKLE